MILRLYDLLIDKVFLSQLEKWLMILSHLCTDFGIDNSVGMPANLWL